MTKTRKESMSPRRAIRSRPGDVVRVDLGSDENAFGRVCPKTIAFYALKTRGIPPIDEIVSKPILFNIWVMDYAVKRGFWPIIGHKPLDLELAKSPTFYKVDPITKRPFLYHEGEQRPATIAECRGRECAAVWELDHIVDRLRNHFAGKPCKWVRTVDEDTRKDERPKPIADIGLGMIVSVSNDEGNVTVEYKHFVGGKHRGMRIGDFKVTKRTRFIWGNDDGTKAPMKGDQISIWLVDGSTDEIDCAWVIRNKP